MFVASLRLLAKMWDFWVDCKGWGHGDFVLDLDCGFVGGAGLLGDCILCCNAAFF
jgi:hypothetical protein